MYRWDLMLGDGKSNKELNALIEKKFQKFVKNKKRKKTEKELQHFQEMPISDDIAIITSRPRLRHQ